MNDKTRSKIDAILCGADDNKTKLDKIMRIVDNECERAYACGRRDQAEEY